MVGDLIESEEIFLVEGGGGGGERSDSMGSTAESAVATPLQATRPKPERP